MGMRLLATVLCVMSGAAMLAAEPAPLPTRDELHKLYDAKEYQPLLQKLARVLQLKGSAAQPYDRVDLLMLRGEALLQIKQQAAAMEAFDSAAKETAAQPLISRKPEQVATARATALLVHQARMFKYTPRRPAPGEKAEGISLLDLSQRPAAFKAMLGDALAEMNPKIKSASRSSSLAPIIDLIRGLGDLRAVETLVNKETKQSDAMLVDLAERAEKLMSLEVDRLVPAEEKISAIAHAKTRHVTYSSQRLGGTTANIQSAATTITMRGLFTADMRDLKQIVATCEQVISASRDFADVTTGQQAAEFNKLEAKAEKLGDSAVRTLNDDYSAVTSN